jgi:hypothetical protein
MKPEWPLRQLLAMVRGIAAIVCILCGLILVQLVPSLVQGGIGGVRDHIVRVATAGVPSEQWASAVSHMYEALTILFLLALLLYAAQRQLAGLLRSRKLR